jgi:HlyD family secretion protein
VKKWIITAVAVVVLAAGGAYYYWWVYVPTAQAEAPKTETAKVERGPLRLIVASTGRVVSNLDVDIKCKASGEIIKLPFDVSDTVKKDDLLVELDPVDMERVLRQSEVELSSSQARLISAKETLAMAERTLATDRTKAESALKSAQAQAKDARAKADRMKQLLDKQLASQEDCDTAETAATASETSLSAAAVKMDELKSQELGLETRRQDVKLAEAAVEADKIALSIAQDRVRDTKVMAPMDGVVSARNVQIGLIIASGVSNVGGGTTILTLSDLSQIFVVASVDESAIGKVKLDQPATITADAYPGKTFKGKVVRIATRGVNVSNVVTFEVKIEVTSEQKALLKPEMTANVEILAAAKDDVLQVPVEAIVRKGRGSQVATVVKDDGTKEEVPVVTGLNDGNKVEVVEGLTEGQTVVVNKGAANSRFSGGPGGNRPVGIPGGKR